MVVVVVTYSVSTVSFTAKRLVTVLVYTILLAWMVYQLLIGMGHGRHKMGFDVLRRKRGLKTKKILIVKKVMI